ncbi:hypothetical protein NRK68_23080 [Streptomyces yangpuensis]|uniref:Uncharacterized protein n=2 Tax=Streptomyces yangpuensis TaxID=1648182 RepID=A0ABY5Q0E4_9ACTN|nr:hypothetical protein [Streptomyces yangpuensis]UUY49856.1 hypothetical protein NRK68_23080 [Streptomyces yangpuensis]
MFGVFGVLPTPPGVFGVLGVFGVFGVLPTPPGVFGVLGVFGVFGVLPTPPGVFGVLGVFGVFGVLPTPPGVFGVLGVFGVFGVLPTPPGVFGVLGVFGVFGVLPTPPGVFGVLGVFGVFGVFRVTTLLHPAFLCLQGVFVVESTALTAVWDVGAARAVAGRAIPPARATEAATRIVLREILNIAFLHSEMRDFCEFTPQNLISSRPPQRRKA